MSKVKMLLDVVKEVKTEAPEDVPNWNAKLAEAKVNLQNQIAKGRLLPKGVEDHPLEHFAFNYSVQRDVRAGHVMNIMKKFDPWVCWEWARLESESASGVGGISGNLGIRKSSERKRACSK